MNEKLKIIFKKYSLIGFVASLVLLILNSFIRTNFFPPVEFARSLVYYVPFVIITTLISLVMGFVSYKLANKNLSKNVNRAVLSILILLSFLITMFLLYVMNFALSFLGSF